MFYFSPIEIMLLVPAFLFAMYAQFKVRNTYEKYRNVPSVKGMTGAQVATQILRSNNIYDVDVEQTPGQLSDHYDPRSKTLRLSDEIYSSSSVAALGIAAHEAGHAIQHNTGYAPLQWRHGLFPVASLGSNLALPLFIIGLFMRSGILMDIGIWFFAGAVIFQLVTLPVEFNASSRALVQLENGGLLNGNEISSARNVLNAAALTYVAAAAVALMHLIRLLVLRSARD
ncbi:zinc metallopeptidase [candidate division KSB1 bacterium]|nr:zinc metallopeptidase [candidate division KSB1 bacterium]